MAAAKQEKYFTKMAANEELLQVVEALLRCSSLNSLCWETALWGRDSSLIRSSRPSSLLARSWEFSRRSWTCW